MPTLSWSLRSDPPVTAAPVDHGSSLGKDIRFDDDLVVAAGGDYATVTEIDALWQSIRVRLATAPGEYKHLPAFGVGINAFLKKPATPTALHVLRQRIIDNLSQDDRVDSTSSVDIAPFTLQSGARAFRIQLAVIVKRQLQRLRPLTFSEAV